jgi:hypothetical protein
MKLRRHHFSPRWHLRRWLKIDALERFAVKYALRQSSIVEKIFNEVRNARETGILGVKMGYQEKSQIILIRYDAVNNGWEVICDLEFASKHETYASVVRELRELVTKYNVQFYLQDSPPVIVGLKHRIGMALKDDPHNVQDALERIPIDPMIDQIAVEAGLFEGSNR